MRYIRIAGLLFLLVFAVGLLLLAGPAAPHTLAQPGQPDLAIDVYLDPNETDPLAPGQEITYQIYVRNLSLYPATDVIVVDTLPAHTTYVSSSGPGFILIQAGPDEVIWVKNLLTDFEMAWLSVTVRVDDDAPVGAVLKNSVEISCSESDSNPDDNKASVEGWVRPAEADLQVTVHMWQNSNPVAAGNEIIYEIVPENWGGSMATRVRLTNTLPANCTYAGDNPGSSGFTTVQTGTVVVWRRASLPPNVQHPGPGTGSNLYVHCRVADDWQPAHWLKNLVEIATTDDEYDYDNNRVRWVYKPEAGRRYGAAVTALDSKTLRLLNDGGFDYLLYYLDWSQAEPSDDDLTLAGLEAAVWQAWRYNLRLVVRVDRAPDWVRGPGSASAPPANAGKLGEFLQVVATRWPRQPGQPEMPQIYGYVIWNEPNLAAEWGGNPPDAVAYAGLLQAAYNGVKAGSPDAWVISAGLATTGDDPGNAVDDRTYLQQLYTADAGSYFDLLGANAMGFASAPDDVQDPNGYNFSRATAWRAIMEANGDGAKGMFGTETGWLRDSPLDLGSDYNWIKVSAVEQAHYLARAYYKVRCDWRRPDGTPWMGPVMTWNLDFAAGDYSRLDHPYWYGIVDQDRDPLRAYRMLGNAAKRGPADLWLEQELIDPVELGQDLRYVIRYTNIGGRTASGVVMTDTLPAGAQYVADTGGGTLLPDGERVVWDVGEVYTCTYQAITLTVHLGDSPPLGGRLINTVEASLLPGEPYTDDNVATVLSILPGLNIQKAVVPAVAVPGGTVTYTLIFSNTGAEVMTGLFITDVVPLTLTNLSYASAGVTITPTGPVSYHWQVHDLAAGQGGIITITGVIPADVSGTSRLANRATITTTSVDPYLLDNVAVVSSTIDAEPPLPPALVAPADGTVGNHVTPTLTWNASPSPDVAGYVLDLNGLVQDVGDATDYAPGVLVDGAYTWTVAAYDAVGHTGAYTEAWTFRVDTQSPAIVATYPTDGATGVEAGASVVVTFSEPIDAGTLVFFATPNPGGWSVSWANGGTVATLSHDPFAYGQAHDLIVTAAADATGNSLASAPYSWSFATAPYRTYLPLVLRAEP